MKSNLFLSAENRKSFFVFSVGNMKLILPLRDLKLLLFLAFFYSSLFNIAQKIILRIITEKLHPEIKVKRLSKV